MKAKCLETNAVELKRGDKVAVYETTTWGFPTRGATTYLRGSGVVVRVYRHIGAVVVRFRQVGRARGRTQFIRASDGRFSVWRLA